jgi:transcriptional regulator with XRE-family HTH domain
MDILAKRLRERAKQLGISNAEAARRAGLDERRFAHYTSGRSEPDLSTLKTIAKALGTTPNWLLGVSARTDGPAKVVALLDRLVTAASGMTHEQLELAVIQAEAIVRSNR